MAEIFRITGKNNIRFDVVGGGNYNLNSPPRGLSKVLTRRELLLLLPQLPLGIRSHALKYGLSVITLDFNIQDTTDPLMEDREHDLLETIFEGQLYIESQMSRGQKVELLYQSFGITNVSYKTVFYGILDELDARDILGPKIRGHRLEGLRLTLYCEPYWHPVSAIELGPNEVKTASFEEYAGAATRADGWGDIGTPTTAIETTKVLQGCESQKIVTDNNTLEGIRAYPIVHAALTSAVAYAWVTRDDPGDDIAVEIWDTVAPGVITTALLSTGGWETEVSGGKTWSRLVVSSDVLIAGRTYWLRVVRRLADATQITTYYVDKAFWLYGTLAPTPVPDEWVGHYTVYNHDDDDAYHINYLDIDDLKGDVDARIFLKLDADPAASTRVIFIVGRRTRGSPCGLLHVREAEDAGAHSFWGNHGDASCADSFCKSNVAADAAGSCTWTIANPPASLLGRFRVYARAWANDIVNTDLRVAARFATSDTLQYNPWVKLGFASAWVIVDLGSIFLDPLLRTGVTTTGIEIRVLYQKDVADTVELDFIMLVPEDEPMLSLDQTGGSALVVGQHVYDATGDFLYYAMEDVSKFYFNLHKQGELSFEPDKENRLYFIEYNENDLWYIEHELVNRETIVSAHYLPQYISPLE